MLLLLASTPPPANSQMIHPLDIALLLILLISIATWCRRRWKEKRVNSRITKVEAQVKELQEIIEDSDIVWHRRIL